MSESVNPVQGKNPPVVDVATASEKAKTTAAGQLNASSTISSVADLKEKAPKVYYQTMVALATAIIKDMKHHNDRLKEMQAEARRNSTS